MEDLIFHDRDQGIFKKILDKSSIIQGRYHLSPDYGYDLNTDNLNEYFKDEKLGLTSPQQKYPLVVCITPRSYIERDENGNVERYVYSIFFLTKENQTGQNQIKLLDKSINKSAHHVWYDWSDMKRVADNFIAILPKVIKANYAKVGVAKLVEDLIPVKRITRVNNDILNGIGITINILVPKPNCELEDYEEGIAGIELPDYKTNPIHPKHKM